MTLVVKLGSSIVAADDGELRAEVLDSVCEQVAALKAAGEDVVLVTSGAIARGIRLLGLEQRPTTMDALQAASAVGQGDLFQAYESRLNARGVKAAQILLTASDISARAHYVNARQTIRKLLSWGFVPIVNENDTTATDEISFGDNDFLAAQVSLLVAARLLVLLTNTDGVFNAHPLAKHAELLHRIDGPDDLVGVDVGSDTSRWGRGGMGSKVAAARMASESGVSVVICNGTEAETLLGAVRGREVGTRFAPHPGKTPAFKLWLRHAKAPKGWVYVDAGAAEKMRSNGASLLPVGVASVEGEFEPGDAVLVGDAQNQIFGKGIIEFSARDLRQVAGMQSNEVRERLPGATDEVIHRDRFVLL